MKLSYYAAFAAAAFIGATFQAHACNPLLGKDYGKHVAPTTLPASMLAKNDPHFQHQSSIVGLWHDVRTASDGSLFMEGFETWAEGGTEYELANHAPAIGNVCTGVYKWHGRTADLTTHVAWLYDLNNNYIGTLNLTQQAKVSKDGATFTGPFEAKFIDPNGVVFQDVTGTTVADRLTQ